MITDKTEAISRLESLTEAIQELASKSSSDEKFMLWRENAKTMIKLLFREEPELYDKFCTIKYSVKFLGAPNPAKRREVYEYGLTQAKAFLKARIEQINNFGYTSEITTSEDLTAHQNIELIINRFHQIALALKTRNRSDREALLVNDEYDFQYLFKALLKIYFDDIRDEEYNSSVGGINSRIDYFLPDVRIIIELKMTREKLDNKKLLEELSKDAVQYSENDKADTIINFIYDPTSKVENPRGFEKDLSLTIRNVDVKTYVTS